jgi:hypothetical protein
MKMQSLSCQLLSLAFSALGLMCTPAAAANQVVELSSLNESVVLSTPFSGGDVLIIDSLVTDETGSLMQQITFTVGPGVNQLRGQAVFTIGPVAGPGPQLVAPNFEIFNEANVLVVTDQIVGLMGSYQITNIPFTTIGAGAYRAVFTGAAIRETQFDATLTFLPVPEASRFSMMVAGLIVLGGFIARRRGASLKGAA